MEEVFLSLVRLGIGNSNKIVPIPNDIDWSRLEDLAKKQGLLGIIVDAVEKLPENQKPPIVIFLRWVGEVLQEYENRYETYKKAIGELSDFYNRHGFRMMVVKGYACSLDWPKPAHRPCGDIDIYLCGKQKEADEALEDWFKIANNQRLEIDRSHYHHTIFEWQGYTVENHYDFLNTRQHRSNVKLEKVMKQLAEDDTRIVDVCGERVYLPSPNFHALFLLRHAMTHLAATSINLRQLMDWAFFVKEHGKEVDWKWLTSILDVYGMRKMFNIFNAICVSNLGFESNVFPTVQFDPFVKDRVLRDILSPEFNEEESKGKLCWAVFIYRRWRSNRWKHELCFNESLWSAFWTGVIGHMMKPS